MKKGLYWILLASFTVFFLLLLQLNEYYTSLNQSNTLILVLVVMLMIVLMAFIVRDIIFRIVINPLNNFTDYVSRKVMDRPITKSLEEKRKVEIYDLLKSYGYSAEEIEEGLARISEKTQFRREFSANVSHELKSPLTSINGYAEMIATGIANEEDSREFASRIIKEGNRLLKMIDETIQLSKIDNHQIKQENFIDFDLGKVIEENIETLSLLAKEKRVAINYSYKKAIISGNEKLIYDMVRNLISNAIKYSGKIRPRLNILQEEDEDYVYLRFKDNGIGISEEDQSRIFERFYVVDRSRGNKTGTGLGLSLVKNIVNIHEGQINVESKLGKGSEFTIVLPKIHNT